MSTINDYLRALTRIAGGEPEGCWEWTGQRNVKGYGLARITRDDGTASTTTAHRLVYEYEVGAVPEGMDIDHLCRNRACCRWDHLEAVTHAENVRRSPVICGTHCHAGHEFTAENTYVRANGTRMCKACHAARRTRKAA